MLIIIQELMHRTFVEIEGRAPKRHEIPKPCDHFDLIAGAGTGGLIAIMLGRLRLDLDTCKELYVRMTRRVFETDKTILGIPLKGTMYKASKLEEVIRECVREHTVFEDEGNDALANATPMSPNTPGSVATPVIPQRTMSQSSRYSQIGMSPINNRASLGSLRFGNPNALLYDTREHRTKTAVTAVLRGTPVTTLLRSYDSRKEPAPDVNCTIWQAGRATSAAYMAFKPIQVGQSVYLDEGAGKYNPAPQILDEAVQNEWPGREVGVFVSIGTGKRPSGTSNQQQDWWEGFLGGSIGEFAEARRRMISKLEACEDVHQSMERDYLMKRGVQVENYYRLNVEVGVGEFGMNEWNRLADISTNTRIYLSRNDVQSYNNNAASKLAKIHFARVRQDRADARRQAGTDGPEYNRSEWDQNSWDRPVPPVVQPSNPMAVELPGDSSFPPDNRYSLDDPKYIVTPGGYDQAAHHAVNRRPLQSAYQTSPQYQSRPDMNHQRPPRSSLSQEYSPSQIHEVSQQPNSPPPLPPKTPVSAGSSYPDQHSPPNHGSQGVPTTLMNMGELGRRLPYPDVDGPPPPVNTANKPHFSR